MKKTLIAFIVLIAIAAGVGFYLWNKPHRTAENEKPAALLTADELFLQFSENEEEATAKYLNQTIQVTGEIADIVPDNGGEVKIALATSDILSEVSCSLVKGEKIDGLETGMEIVIKGICIGYDTDVQLQQSVLVRK